METVSLIDKSTKESHLDGLIDIMVVMGIAKRDELFMRAWNEACLLLSNDEEKIRDMETRVINRAKGFSK